MAFNSLASTVLGSSNLQGSMSFEQKCGVFRISGLGRVTQIWGLLLAIPIVGIKVYWGKYVGVYIHDGSFSRGPAGTISWPIRALKRSYHAPEHPISSETKTKQGQIGIAVIAHITNDECKHRVSTWGNMRTAGINRPQQHSCSSSERCLQGHQQLLHGHWKGPRHGSFHN